MNSNFISEVGAECELERNTSQRMDTGQSGRRSAQGPG